MKQKNLIPTQPLHSAGLAELVNQFELYCRNHAFNFHEGTTDGSRDKPKYSYLNGSCVSRRQHLSEMVFSTAKCDVLIEIGAYLNPIASIRSHEPSPKINVIVDPSAPACTVRNETQVGGPITLEAPALLGDLWSEVGVRGSLQKLAQQNGLRMCTAWLGFGGTFFPSWGSPVFREGPGEDGDAVGVLDYKSAEAMRALSTLSRVVIVEGPACHCSWKMAHRSPYFSCGPEWFTYYFGRSHGGLSLHEEMAAKQNLEDSNNNSNHTRPWRVEPDCLARDYYQFPCLFLNCTEDDVTGRWFPLNVQRQLFIFASEGTFPAMRAKS